MSHPSRSTSDRAELDDRIIAFANELAEAGMEDEADDVRTSATYVRELISGADASEHFGDDLNIVISSLTNIEKIHSAYMFKTGKAFRR
jgi:hypothetical protein